MHVEVLLALNVFFFKFQVSEVQCCFYECLVFSQGFLDRNDVFLMYTKKYFNMFHSNYVVLYIQKICMFVQNFLSYFHFSDCSYNIMNTWNGIKGYLRYKTIPAQNVSFEAQVKKMLILQKSYVPFSRFSTFCIFNHSMIYQILCHDEYWYMRQRAFLNISFEPQLIKSPSLAN